MSPVRRRCASRWQLEQWNECWGVRAQFEQWSHEHEHEHRVPLRFPQSLDLEDNG